MYHHGKVGKAKSNNALEPILSIGLIIEMKFDPEGRHCGGAAANRCEDGGGGGW